MRTTSRTGFALHALALIFCSAFVAIRPASAQVCDGLGVVKLHAADLALSNAGGEQEFPAIAAGDTSYLAVWADDRADFTRHTTGIRSRDVFARRIAADGTALDAVSFRVAGGLGRKDDVRVSWNGSHWLVTWTQDLPTQFHKAIAIAGVRVARDGTVLDATPIHVRAYGFSSNVQYALGSDGTGWAVVCQGSSAGEASVEGRLIASDGTVTAGPAPLLASTSLWGGFELCFANGKYLLGASGSNMQGRLLGPDLVPLASAFTLAAQGNAKIATDGFGYLVTYSASPGVGSQIFVRAMSSTGVLGAPQAVTPSSIEYTYDPAVAWNGTDYVVAFTRGLASPTNIFAARVAQSGTVVDFGGLPVATGTDARDARVASLAQGEAEIVWVRGAGLHPFVSDVLSTSFGANGTTGSAVGLSNGRPRQGDPDLAAGGEGYLAVFMSERDTLPRVMAQRLDRFGNPLDADVIEVASGPTLNGPRVAWNGDHFLIVWEDPGPGGFSTFPTDDATFGRRIAADGTLLDAAPFQILLGGMPDVAAVGTTFLVAASQAVTTQIRRIFVARVDGAGAVLDTNSVEVGSNFARWPQVAAFDDRWIVTWQRNPTHDNPAASVRYAVVMPDATSLGEVSVAGGSRPGIAASDSVGLILISPGISALRVDKNGQPLGGIFPLVDEPNLQVEPSGDWTGTEFVVAWEDERDIEAFFDDRRDIYATQVLEDGTVVTFDGCEVSARPDHDQMPVVAGRDGDFLLAFAKYEPAAPVASVRVAYARGSEWTGIDAGGLAGTAGTPILEGDGALVGSGVFQLMLFGAAPSALTYHAIGLSRIDFPLFGGILIPSVDFLLPAMTGPDGSALTNALLPPTLPPGLELWMQSWVLDAAAVQGVAASNALTQ
ncbi:MAG: hypothetical protein WD226_05495 [Planctomycetota bacterium]